MPLYLPPPSSSCPAELYISAIFSDPPPFSSSFRVGLLPWIVPPARPSRQIPPRGESYIPSGTPAREGGGGGDWGSTGQKKGIPYRGAYPIHQPGQASHPGDGKRRMKASQPSQTTSRGGNHPVRIPSKGDIQACQAGQPGYQGSRSQGKGWTSSSFMLILSRQAYAQGWMEGLGKQG